MMVDTDNSIKTYSRYRNKCYIIFLGQDKFSYIPQLQVMNVHCFTLITQMENLTTQTNSTNLITVCSHMKTLQKQVSLLSIFLSAWCLQIGMLSFSKKVFTIITQHVWPLISEGPLACHTYFNVYHMLLLIQVSTTVKSIVKRYMYLYQIKRIRSVVTWNRTPIANMATTLSYQLTSAVVRVVIKQKLKM